MRHQDVFLNSYKTFFRDVIKGVSFYETLLHPGPFFCPYPCFDGLKY